MRFYLSQSQSCLISNRRIIILGSFAQAVVMVFFGLLPVTASVLWVVAGVVFQGLTSGMYLAALHQIYMNDIPPEQAGSAAGLFTMIRFGGFLLGAAIGGVLLQHELARNLEVARAYSSVFWWVAGVGGLGFLISFGLKEQLAARSRAT